MTVTGETIDAGSALSVATDTPPHLHRRNALDLLHLWYLAMALLTRNSRLHVTLVIKLRVIRENVNLHPRDWLSALVVVLELLDVLLALLALAGNKCSMTSHAGLNFRNRRVRCFSDRPVAVLALHLILLHVNYVAKINWLLRLVASRTLWRTKVMKVVSDVEIPKGRLPIVKHPRAGTYCGIAPGFSRSYGLSAPYQQVHRREARGDNNECRSARYHQHRSDFFYHG